MKEHVQATLVNELTLLAQRYHNHQSLRKRIKHLLLPVVLATSTEEQIMLLQRHIKQERNLSLPNYEQDRETEEACHSTYTTP
jgi:hypothetical protein